MQPDLLETSNRKIYTVSELNESVRRRLEQGFGKLWLEGEISNLSAPASGHLYFTLKDSDAQVRCALFRSARRNGRRESEQRPGFSSCQDARELTQLRGDRLNLRTDWL